MGLFIKSGYFCVIPKENDETMEMHIFRGMCVISQKPNCQSDYDKWVNLSYHKSNNKFLGCSYTQSINEQCDNMNCYEYINDRH